MSAIIYKFKQLIKFNQIYNHVFRNQNGLFSVENIPGTSNFFRKDVMNLDIVKKKNNTLNKITTWNIQELFWYCYKGDKINNIIQKLNEFDSEVICLQEVFENKTFDLIINNHSLKQKYPYFLSGTLANRFLVGEHSGLLVLSKYPIVFKQFTQFHQTTIPDILACKGALYFSIGDYNFISTHLQSACTLIARRQLHNIILNSPFKNKTILLGDLNFEFPHEELCLNQNNNKITHMCSSSILDHIISIHEDIPLNIEVDYFDLNQCSDHWPVHAYLK